MRLEKGVVRNCVAQKGVVTPGRLELPTRSLGNCCSIHLSYGATNCNRLILDELL
jgi:hypothetical protein